MILDFFGKTTKYCCSELLLLKIRHRNDIVDAKGVGLQINLCNELNHKGFWESSSITGLNLLSYAANDITCPDL